MITYNGEELSMTKSTSDRKAERTLNKMRPSKKAANLIRKGFGTNRR
ncbi:MAG: hypothetical protein WC262_10015 [Bacteroidales bacterium]|jgi:hypothetical protein